MCLYFDHQRGNFIPKSKRHGKTMLEKLQQLNTVVRENEPLKNHTTFQIGGPARFYIEALTPEDLIAVLKILKEEKVDYLMLGGGSNLLVSDSGYNGAVIKLKPRELQINGLEVVVDSGYTLAGLLMKALETGLTGLEFAAGVPGTVGGAIKGNAGTYGEAMSKVVEKVFYINENLQKAALSNDDCRFSYRHSVFKEHEDWLITAAVLKLQRGNMATSRQLIDERIDYRTKTQPYGYPSAGCTFKNIIYNEEIGKKLTEHNLTIPDKFKEYKKVPASWIIDHLGLKGKTIGQAQVSEKHANYIVNLGGATADNVVQLISLIKQQSRDHFGIQLEEEVRYLGF